MTDLVFMDTETLGLPAGAPIWEFAAIRRKSNGDEENFHCFIKHGTRNDVWLKDLPEQFVQDYERRYQDGEALDRGNAAALITRATKDAHVVGAVPSFDTVRLGHLLALNGFPSQPWHYHLTDIENVVVGYLAAKGELIMPPWKSNDLSKALGVDPEKFDRHTAMGDCEWVRAQWDVIMGQS